MRLARAFTQSRYICEGVVLRIGRRAGVDALLARLGAREAALLTAWNPHGRKRPEGWNRRAQRALDAALRGVAWRQAASVAGAWHEEMRAAALPRRRALGLARRFRQAAILWLRRGTAARLVWCGP